MQARIYQLQKELEMPKDLKAIEKKYLDMIIQKESAKAMHD